MHCIALIVCRVKLSLKLQMVKMNDFADGASGVNENSAQLRSRIFVTRKITCVFSRSFLLPPSSCPPPPLRTHNSVPLSFVVVVSTRIISFPSLLIKVTNDFTIDFFLIDWSIDWLVVHPSPVDFSRLRFSKFL